MAYIATRPPGLGLVTEADLQVARSTIRALKAQVASTNISVKRSLFEKLLREAKDRYQAALAEKRAADLSAATFEAQMAAAEKKAEADLQAKLEAESIRRRDLQAQQQADAALQTSLLTVSPSSLFAPAVATAPVSAGLLSSSMMPFVIGGGLLLAVLFLKKGG